MIDVKELKELCQNFSILYVEDDDAIQNVMTQYLEKFFLTVVSASDGVEGLNAYKNAQFDIVITDLSMPNMGGLEMLQKIKMMNDDQAVLISHQGSIINDVQLLINLSSTAAQPAKIERIAEVLNQQTDSKQTGRDHYKIYRDLGLELHHHEIKPS